MQKGYINKISKEFTEKGMVMTIETNYPETEFNVLYTGYKGGDAGHGGELRIECISGDSIFCEEATNGFTIRALGDMEMGLYVQCMSEILKAVEECNE